MTSEERAKELVLAQAPRWGNWFPDARVGDTICTETIISDVASAIREAVEAEREEVMLLAAEVYYKEMLMRRVGGGKDRAHMKEALRLTKENQEVFLRSLRSAIHSRSNKPAVTDAGNIK